MSANGWLQLVLILGGLVAITKPLGIYLVRVLDPEHEGPTFLDALREQLGLRLESAKAPLRVLVIDHIERPSEN